MWAMVGDGSLLVQWLCTNPMDDGQWSLGEAVANYNDDGLSMTSNFNRYLVRYNTMVKPAVVAEWSEALSQIQVESMP